MAQNNFHKTSQLSLTVSLSKSKDKTIIKDSFFTSPFKIMKPFERDDGGISIFQQTASAGILSGDVQEHRFIVEKDAILEIKSQSFEKIFKMDEGTNAKRRITAIVDENAKLIYTPLPCIPFEDSDFESETKIFLKEKSKLIYKDCLCSGRKAFGEEFKFRRFKNKIEIRLERKTENPEEKIQRLIFRDNTILEGKKQEKIDRLKSNAMFGTFSHIGTMILIGFELSSKKVNEKLNIPEKLLYINSNKNETENNEEKLIGVTNFDGGICIKILANNAEDIEKIFNQISED